MNPLLDSVIDLKLLLLCYQILINLLDVTVCQMLVLRAFSWVYNSFDVLGMCQERHLIPTDTLDSMYYRYSD